MGESAALCKKLIDIRPGECVSLGGLVLVELLHKTGRIARLQVTAPREVTIEKIGAVGHGSGAIDAREICAG